MVLVDVDEFPVALAQSEFPDLLAEAKTPRQGTPPTQIDVPSKEDALLDELLDDDPEEHKEIIKSKPKLAYRGYEKEKKEDDMYLGCREKKEADTDSNRRSRIGDLNRRERDGDGDFNGRNKTPLSKYHALNASKRAQLFHVKSRVLENAEQPPAETYDNEKTISSDDTSRSTESADSPQDNVGMEEFLKYENVGDKFKDDSSARSEETSESDNTDDLLSRAHDRICLQTLQEEILALKCVIDQKNDDIEKLSGQLRRAVATKCDLVLAHTELERSHEHNMKIREQEMKQLNQANFNLLELRAEVEKEFMNEITKLTDDIKDLEEKHREELDDWERLHRNEILEKDFQIAQLSEEIRKVTGKPALHSVRKKKGLTAMFQKQ